MDSSAFTASITRHAIQLLHLLNDRAQIAQLLSTEIDAPFDVCQHYLRACLLVCLVDENKVAFMRSLESALQVLLKQLPDLSRALIPLVVEMAADTSKAKLFSGGVIFTPPESDGKSRPHSDHELLRQLNAEFSVVNRNTTIWRTLRRPDNDDDEENDSASVNGLPKCVVSICDRSARLNRAIMLRLLKRLCNEFLQSDNANSIRASTLPNAAKELAEKPEKDDTISPESPPAEQVDDMLSPQSPEAELEASPASPEPDVDIPMNVEGENSVCQFVCPSLMCNTHYVYKMRCQVPTRL